MSKIKNKKTNGVESNTGSTSGYCVLPCREVELDKMSKREFLTICDRYFTDRTENTIKALIKKHSEFKLDFKNGIGRTYLPENVSVGMLGILSTHFNVSKINDLSTNQIQEAILVLSYMYKNSVPIFSDFKVSFTDRKNACSVYKISNYAREEAIKKGLNGKFGSEAVRVVTSLVGSNTLIRAYYPFEACKVLLEKMLNLIVEMEKLDFSSSRIG